jgi:hypothetical protein
LETYRTVKHAPLADSTKEGMMRAVKTFLGYLLEHRIIEANPLEVFPSSHAMSPLRLPRAMA